MSETINKAKDFRNSQAIDIKALRDENPKRILFTPKKGFFDKSKKDAEAITEICTDSIRD